MRTLLLLVAAIGLLAPLPARAQKPTVVVAPPHVKGRLDDAMLAAVVAELEQAFRAGGWRVTGLAEALQLSVATPGPCNNNACALAYAEAAHTSAALQLSVFGTSSVTFSLALVQPPGDAFVHGGAFPDPSRPAESIAQATTDLLAQHARGAGPWLIVDGSPLDAAVRLDGDVIGVVPLRRRISGGEHVIVVSAEGYDDHNDTIWLDNVAGAVKEVHVNLSRSNARVTSESSRVAQRRVLVPPKPLDWLVGGATSVAGIAYLVSGLAQGGSGSSECGASCARTTELRSPAVAVGASAAALGIGWLFVSPFARWLTPSASRTDARLTFRAAF